MKWTLSFVFGLTACGGSSFAVPEPPLPDANTTELSPADADADTLPPADADAATLSPADADAAALSRADADAATLPPADADAAALPPADVDAAELAPDVPTATYTPLSLGGRLVVWLDATKGLPSSGAVTIWADQSGYENHAQRPRPEIGQAPSVDAYAINGLPAVRFSGGTDFLTVPDSSSLHFGTDDVIAAAVLEHDSDAASESRIVLTKQAWEFPYVGLGLFVNYGNTNGAAAQLVYHQVVAPYVPNTGSLADNRPHLLVFRRGGERLELRIDGALVSSTSAWLNGSTIDLSNGTDLRIGGQGAAFQTLRGDISEILILRGHVAAEELRDLEHYLSEKYRLAM